MSTLVLYGKLAELVGQNRVPLEADTIREMVHAISSMVPEVIDPIKSSNWTVVNGPLEGGVSVGVDELDIVPAPEVHLLPAAEGGSGGGMMILGAALIAAAVFFPPAAAIAPALMGAGAGMMVGGLAQMLVKTPKTATNSSSSEDSSSFIFGDSNGTTQQGKCLPVTYGIDVVDPIIVSVSIAAEDYVD